jgi:DHA3 family macrolide efflux protein-like MFS transporter
MQLGMVVWGPLSDIISLNWIMVGTGALVALIGITVFFDKTMQEAGSVLP